MKYRKNQLGCDAVLFDLDGVLIDSTSSIVHHWKVWADRHGFDLDKIMQIAHGVRTIETIEKVAPHLDAKKEEAEFTAREIADTDGVVAIDGADRIVESLPLDAWGIVTSGSTELAKARLRRAGLPIPEILVTADMVTQGKPAPEPYLLGAERLGVAAGRCIVIEDSAAGVEAGRKADMRVIGICATHTREELLEKGADVVIAHLSDLEIRKNDGESRLLLLLQDSGTES